MNVLCIAGNICRDIEERTTQGGDKVANFSVAINEGKDKTEFVNCVAFGKTAELLIQYCQKGQRLSCSGRIQTRSWEDQSGTKCYSTEMIVNQFDFPPKQARQGEAFAPQGGVDDFDDEIAF